MVYRGRFPGLVPGKRVCGPLRLPDVKPPCSNLAGAIGSGHFSLGEMVPGSHRGPGRRQFIGSRLEPCRTHSRTALRGVTSTIDAMLNSQKAERVIDRRMRAAPGAERD